MRKFITALAIKGTRKELEPVQRSLEDMGYRTGTTEPHYRAGNTILVTDYAAHPGEMGYSVYNKNDVDRTLIDASNSELVLALAAMTDDPTGMRGEWYVCTNPGSGSFTEGKLYKQTTRNFEDRCAILDNEGESDGWGGNNYQHFRKATKKEILAHFSVKAEAPTEFVLPERWYINVTKENQTEVSRWIGFTVPVGNIAGKVYQTFPKAMKKGHNGAGKVKNDGLHSYDFGIEITFEQFQEHVLKQETMAKIIVGYNLKPGIEEGPVERALSIGNVRSNKPYNISAGSMAVDRALRLKVLDVWFDAVYEDETVTVQGHTAELDSLGRVKLGCQHYNKEQLLVVKNLLERTGAKHEIRVDGEEITIELVDKLLKMIK